MKLSYDNARAGIKGTIIVRLDGKRIGIILPTADKKGWRYRAQGLARWEGATFNSLDACKASLEMPA